MRLARIAHFIKAMCNVVFVLNDLLDTCTRDVKCTPRVNAFHKVLHTLCVWCEHVATHRAMVLENVLPLQAQPV